MVVDVAVGIEGESEEGRWPVTTGEDASYRALVDWSAGKVWGVLATPGGTLDGFGWGIEWGETAADSGGTEFGVKFGDRVGDLLAGELITVCFAFGVGGEEIGTGGHQLLVVLAGPGPIDDGLVFKVPTLTALGHP
jgi:hypothetical protein